MIDNDRPSDPPDGPPIVAKLLLVDDLEDNLVALEALLRRDDVEVLQARDGNQALELLLRHDVALALVDVQMPEMDGFELAELMRGSERTRQVPIIFVTAGARESHRIFQGYDAGAVDFLFKPLEAHVLRNKVATFVQVYRQRRMLSDQLERERRAQVERERLVAELRETLRLNELFTAALGHDLRNPISAVGTSAEVLMKRSDDPLVRRTAERLRSVSERMGRMIAELLDLARTRLGGGIPINPSPINADALAHQVVDEIALVHADRAVILEVLGASEGTCDPDRVAQVLTNLITNALEHGEPLEPVRVLIDGRDPSRLLLSVTNRGTIPAELMPQLFDPFRSGRKADSAPRGLGLGLYIVQQIARAHGGTVEATSEGGFTRFTVQLPRTSRALTPVLRPQADA